MTTLTGIAWNAHGNSTAVAGRVVTGLDRLVEPEDQFAVLTEAKGAHLPLTRWCERNGWTLFQEKPDRRRGGEAGDTALLVRTAGRNRVEVSRAWLAVMAAFWWVVRYNVRHDPRRYQRARLRVGNQRVKVRLSGEHWPTDAPKNRPARDEALSAALRFLSRRGPAIIVGDLNADLNTVGQLADDVSGRARGIKPDWCLTNGARIDMTPLGHGGSDHRAYRYVVSL